MKKLEESERYFFGAGPVVVATGTDEWEGPFYAIQVLADAIFETFDENNVTEGSDAMTGFTIPAGTVLVNAGGIRTFKLTSGKARAHVAP